MRSAIGLRNVLSLSLLLQISMDLTKAQIDDLGGYTKSDWLNKISTELKQRDYTTLFTHLEDGISVEPFYTQEDASNYLILPKARIPVSWKITDYISGKGDFRRINADLLQTLAYGSECIILDISSNSPDDLNEILSGVHTKMIDLVLETANSNAIQTWIAYVNKHGLRGKIRSQNNSGVPQLLDQKPLEISISCGENGPIDSASLANMVLNISTLLHRSRQSGPELSMPSIFIKWHLSEVFLRDIVYLRAWHKLTYALAASYGYSSFRPGLECILGQPGASNPFDQMIAYSSMAIAAACSGADRICAQALAESEIINRDASRRIARNVLHLLKMETDIEEAIDPARGSYWMESASEMIAENAWEKFCSTEKERRS